MISMQNLQLQKQLRKQKDTSMKRVFALFLKEEIDYETFTEEDEKKIKLLIIKIYN